MKKFTIEQLENIIKDQFLIANLKSPIEITIEACLTGSNLMINKYSFVIYQREKDAAGIISHRFSASTIDELKKLLKDSIKAKNI